MRDSRRLSVALGTMTGAVFVSLALAVSAHAQAPAPKVLVYHGASDATTDAGVAALEAIGTANNFTVDDTELATELTDANLANYRAVVFLNTPGDRLNATQETAVKSFVEGGGGFLGIGSAAEVEPGTAFFDTVIGARPTGPGTSGQQVVEVGDRVHPSTKDLPLEWPRTDVWYQWTTRPTGTVHTVARYRAPNAPAGDGTNTGGTDTPISWCRDIQKGRSFYTGMGRTAASYSEDGFKGHLAGGLKWAAGLIRAGCKATISSNYRATRLVSGGATTTGLATSGESHGLTIAPNGWVIYIGRGDCRTDAERGALIGVASQPRVLNHADPNVGLGCGSVHVWDPAAYNGTENSGVTRAATLAVYADGGTGSERTNESQHKMEYGLLGITVAPDFLQTGHVYMQYFPSFNPNAKPAGLPVERRISKMSRPRISRFTMNLQTKKIDLDSEVRIFEYDAQVFSCCHVGGGMGFDSQGNLYVTTGDTNSSQCIGCPQGGGYSGNNPTPKCPTGPANEASSAHCGANTFSFQDARRTAGNTNDYNGKMLRFKPVNIPDGQHPAVGIDSTYTIPGDDAPNGPNLFDGTEGGGGKTKPEIYAMGLRNPSRLSIDPKTDIPYSGWVGPDAGVPSREMGPSTYETLSQIDRAGNYGWPYCMGDKQAYRDRLSATDLRSTNVRGYVSGGPATGGTDGWYDCDNLVNDSPNNTGLTVLPHTTGTGMDAGKVRPVNLWYSRGNPGGNGCPEFPRPRGGNSAPDYGAQNTQLCPYATANGATVMDGPVYRFDEQASDNSRRWPKYWDGRWFIQDHGNTSVKHAVLLDPATDQDGSQPVYADSFRGAAGFSWQGNYMDSKFGPDGAWYVQTYDGFFRAGPNVGITRIDYIGGPDTPFANPTASAIGNKQIKFSSAGSGGVSVEWDFGDGSPVSTELNPTHTYAQGGHFTAKLTVTYADNSTSVKTVEVDVLDTADTIKPVTEASLNPASPGPGGTYSRPVTVTLNATDQGGTGVAKTEYRVNGGALQTYTQPFRLSSERQHTVEFFSTDGAGNVEDTKTVSFTIEIPENCPTSLSDEFDSATLDPKWQILRDNPGARSLSNGRLHMLVRNGDMIGGTATAQNVLLQPVPAGGWTASTKIGIADLSNSGEQTGLVLWQSENPNNFAKIVFINKGGGTLWFEYVLTLNGSTDRLPNTGAITNVPSDVYIRAISNGQGTVTPEYSLDGEDWNPIGGPITELGTNLKVGLKVSDTADSPNAAHFDWFHFDCQDLAPPVTTATVAPASADGELGWYSSAPQVTLAADDGATGTGVEKTEYRIGTTGTFQPYTAPFTVTQPGRQTVQYRSSDNQGNEEAVRSLALAVDPQAPTTTASVAPASGDSVRVALAANDGTGAGVREVRYRVDGGAWQTYAGPAAEKMLLDGTQAALDNWDQAGPGGFDLQPDGSIQAHGGLGMLWYPVKPFSDFALRLQFRDARTDGAYANSGAFVRFPNPEAVVALPSNQRPSCVTANEDRPEWVAIFCGQEIQMYDGPTGEPQKTGSIYNFQSLNLAQAMPVPKGTWSDYEVRVVGQQYTIIRDGQIINQFDNSIPKNSSRGGDPPTQDRQFASGYIGLQNHSDADKMQIRNVRVQDLSNAARAGTGAFLVTGRGNHTVEFRSTDWAGNVETTKAEMFRIGAPPQGNVGGNEQPERPTFRLGQLAKPKLGAFARRGLAVKLTCTGDMDGAAALTVSRATMRRLKLKSRTLARKAITCSDAGTKTVRLKASRKVAKALRKSRRAVKATLTVRLAADGEPTRMRTRSLTLRK